MGKNKAYAPTLPRIRYMCLDLTQRSRCNSSTRCCYRAREVRVSDHPAPVSYTLLYSIPYKILCPKYNDKLFIIGKYVM